MITGDLVRLKLGLGEIDYIAAGYYDNDKPYFYGSGIIVNPKDMYVYITDIEPAHENDMQYCMLLLGDRITYLRSDEVQLA